MGGDARTVRVLVFEKDRIVGRIQGRWDIGYELLRDSPQSSEEFLIVRRFVLPEDLQGPTESLVWVVGGLFDLVCGRCFDRR